MNLRNRIHNPKPLYALLKGREELSDDMTDMMEAGMATIKDEDLKQLVAETATGRAKQMGEKVKKLLKKAAAQVSIVPRHPHKQNVTKETKKKFDEIDPVRVD